MKAAVEYEKREMRRLLACKIKRAATGEVDVEGRNGLPVETVAPDLSYRSSFSSSFALIRSGLDAR